MRKLSFSKKRNGFTLLELMIAVAIIAGIAAIAIPAFQRYIYTAKEAEMVAALGAIYKETERIKVEAASREGGWDPYTQFLYSQTAPHFYYRPSGNPKFNLVTGSIEEPPVSGFWALSQFPEWGHLKPEAGKDALNEKFGVRRLPGGEYKILYGAEYNMDGDNSYHVLAIDQHGSLFKLCDDFTNSRPGENVYQTFSEGYPLVCNTDGMGGGSDDGGDDGCQGLCL